jgi:hypothetical protein
MSNNAIFSHGTLIQRETAPGSTVYTTIAEIMDLTPPALTRNTFETTSHNDSEDSYIVGLKRKGEITFKVNWIPTDPTHDDSTGLIASWNSGALENYRIVWPGVGNGYWQVPAYVINFQPESPTEGVQAANVTLKPSGDMVFA